MQTRGKIANKNWEIYSYTCIQISKKSGKEAAKKQQPRGKFVVIHAANIKKKSGKDTAKKQQPRGKFTATTR
jgi:hypothetical protein